MKLFSHSSKSIEACYYYGEIIQEVWYTQGIELVKALIQSMPRRYEVVIQAQDGWTKVLRYK